MLKCDVHQKNLAKSLNELYTEPASTIFPFDLPHEFPLTRSVSTTTDIFSNCSGGFGASGFTSSIINANSNKSFRTFTPQLHKRTNTDSNFSIENNFRSISRGNSRDSLNETNGNGNGATRGILTKRQKSKDELFNEFCKKAGQRPKPKDIYFIQDTSQDSNPEECVFVVDNYATIRKNRRNSAINSRKSTNLYNSNQSLMDGNGANGNKHSYPLKNIFDLDSFGGSTETGATFLNNHVNNNYFSQDRNNSRESSLYQSRTLPRDFLKRNVDFSFEDDSEAGRRTSASGLYRPYNNTLAANVCNIASDEEYYKKSYDTLASRNSRQCDAYAGGEDTLPVHWPNAIPGSPSNFSNRLRYQIHTPAAYTPTHQNVQRMSSFYSQHNFTHTTPNKRQSINHGTDKLHNVDKFNDCGIQTINPIIRDGSVNSSGDQEYGFDLDRLEKERRKSHANLFTVDFENGTPV